MAEREALGRRAFLAASSGLIVGLGCRRAATTSDGPRGEPRVAPVSTPAASAVVTSTAVEADASVVAGPSIASSYKLFEAYPALGKRLDRVELGQFPSPLERALLISAPVSPSKGSAAAAVWIKRDDDFTRSPSWQSSFDLARLFGGGKVRKLELFFGEARAQGKKRIITSGGVGSNQTLAVALLGKALGFSVRMHLAPQPVSTLTAKNLAADAASHAEMRLFSTVTEAHAQALRDAQSGDTYVIPPGGTTPLGTLGFVNAGLELAEDIRLKRIPAPSRIYVALGLGGTAAGLAIGLALSGVSRTTEIIAVRTSSPGSVTKATLKAIHNETIAFVRARDPSFDAVAAARTSLSIDDRFVGGGYGVPTPAGADAIDRARRTESWELDPVYTGKALAALLDDAAHGEMRGAPEEDPLLFWNTASSRPVATATIPANFERFAKVPS